MFANLKAKLVAAYAYLSEAGHRRALAMLLVFLAARLTTKLAGLDVDTVDALLVLLLPPVAAWSHHGDQPVQS